jgi:NAD(P)-dependent dehydrogenase (short-subunit alcohol dehydrogenase family)
VAETGGYHVVLGATGGAGRALVAELARQNRRVRAVSRRASEPWPTGVEAVTADILRADEVRKACRDAAVVYHAANVPYAQWQQVLPAMTESVIAGASAADAVLVVADNLYMYGPSSGPMTEDSPRRASGPKGQLRARLEEMFLAAHRSGRVGVAIGRGSDFYGPHATSAANMLVIEPASAGEDGLLARVAGCAPYAHLLAGLCPRSGDPRDECPRLGRGLAHSERPAGDGPDLHRRGVRGPGPAAPDAAARAGHDDTGRPVQSADP